MGSGDKAFFHFLKFFKRCNKIICILLIILICSCNHRSESECSYLCSKNPKCTAFTLQAQNSECQMGNMESLVLGSVTRVPDQLISVFVKINQSGKFYLQSGIV